MLATYESNNGRTTVPQVLTPGVVVTRHSPSTRGGVTLTPDSVVGSPSTGPEMLSFLQAGATSAAAIDATRNTARTAAARPRRLPSKPLLDMASTPIDREIVAPSIPCGPGVLQAKSWRLARLNRFLGPE